MRIRGNTGRTIGLGCSLLIGGLCLPGCSGTSRQIPEATLRELAEKDDAAFHEEFKTAVQRVFARVARRAAESPTGEVTMDILALSGGGDYGAFGAGLLVGWKDAPGDMKRPDFDVVTGVSTGAMLAPFAYVGTDESYLTVENFYKNPRPDWVEEHWPFFFMPSNESFATIPGLTRDIRGALDINFAKAMAAQSEKGKLLLVAASNLDLSKQRYWPLGPYAEQGVKDGNLEEVERRMLASSAIPVVFPPVKIGEFLYCDGGVTANVLLKLDPKDPDGFIQVWRRTFPGKPLPHVRYWIIINNQLHPSPEAVAKSWMSIMSPALAMSVRSGTLAEVRWLTAEAMYVNAEYGGNIEVRVTAIPDDWRPPVKGSFMKETMNSLATLGEKMGADPSTWTVWCNKAMSDSRDSSKPPESPTGLPRSETPPGK